MTKAERRLVIEYFAKRTYYGNPKPMSWEEASDNMKEFERKKIYDLLEDPWFKRLSYRALEKLRHVEPV